MANIVIVGAGPAGISAALYTARASIHTTVICMGSGALKKAEKIQNYYGFPQGISGEALESAGIKGAENVGAAIVRAQVVGFGFTDQLVVNTDQGDYPADSIIIATGSSRVTPPITGIEIYEGKGVSYCAVCDAFFYRKKKVAVVGAGAYALHEVKELLSVVGEVELLTNGEPITVAFPPEVHIHTMKISAITGGDRVEGVRFEDGTSSYLQGIFVACGVAGSADLAKKIGVFTEKSNITIDSNMATNVPGVFAAGDCTGGMLQVCKAVYEGARAGTEAIKYVRKKKNM
jgi:thioredoxin reductase (NADPH)